MLQQGFAPSTIASVLSDGEVSTTQRTSKTNPAGPPTVRHFGDYDLLEEIARGGMGIVYRARQVSLNRVVAIKMLLSGPLSSPELVKRFRAEASAAAGLQHPNIVAIHEVGVHEGQQYFAMDFVEGQSLAKLLTGGPLPPMRAATYLKAIAEAIHYAHECGLLHRDLKPSNVLIDTADQPRITDFGLARRLEGDSELTLSGQVLGSPNYMPPEQAGAKRGQLSRQSDVYALGAMLYHVLTGRPPFVGETIADTLAQVINSEPVSPRLLNPSVPRDLETLCLKCLEKEPSKRYATALALADELGLFLRGEPIMARPLSRFEKVWRWCRRKQAIAALSTAIIVLLLAVAIGSPIAAIRFNRERQRAEDIAGKESQARRSAEQRLYVADIGIAQQAIEEGNLGRARSLLQAYKSQKEQEGLLSFEWRYLWQRCQGDELATLREPSGLVQRIAISPDGAILAAASMDNALKLWDPKSGRLLAALSGHRARVYALVFSPDGELLASGSCDRTVKLWNMRSRSEVNTIQAPDCVRAVAFSPDGQILAIGCEDGSLRLQGCRSDVVIANLKGQGASLVAAAFAPSGRVLVTGSDDAILTVWDIEQRKEIAELRGHQSRICSLAFAVDGEVFASGSADGTVRLWSITTKQSMGVLDAHSGQVAGIAFSPTEQLLATAHADGSIRVWDVPSGMIRRILRGHLNEVVTIAFFPDGKTLASGSKDETIKFWNLAAENQKDVLKDFGSRIQAVGFSPNNRSFAAVSVTNGARRYDLSSLSELSTARGVSPDHTLSFSAHHFGRLPWGFATDGEHLAFRTTNETLEVYNLVSDQKATVLEGYTNSVVCICFLDNGQLLATGDDSGVVQIWSTSGGQKLMQLNAHAGWVSGLALSTDRILATGGGDRIVRLWNFPTGEEIASLTGHRDWVGPMAFSPDGRFLVTSCYDGFLKIWEVKTRHELLTIPNAHKGFIFGLAFSPDGKTLATCGVDGAVNLWNPSTWRLTLTLKGHTAAVGCLAFSRDGTVLATGSDDQSVRIWRAPR